MPSEITGDNTSISEGTHSDAKYQQSVSRLEWIDCAKGIGVICVVLVHSIIPVIIPITKHLSSFTIPIFFILAGLTYNNRRHRDKIKSFATSRARQFLIPYIILYWAEILLFIPVSTLNIFPLTPDQLIFWFFYGAGPPYAATHLWFLAVVYFSLMIFVCLDRFLQHTPNALRWIVFMLFPLLTTSINSIFFPSLVPWRLGIIFLATSFVFIGNEMRRIKNLEIWTSGSHLFDFFTFIIIACILVFVSEYNGFTDIALDNYGINAWLYLCTGTLGTILVFMLSNAITSVSSLKQVFLTYGTNSQEVYEIHPPLFYLVPLFMVLLGGTIEDYLDLYAHLWFIRFILGISISLLISTKFIKKNKLLSIIFKGRYDISRVRVKNH
jgi:fucose 4-O-acetylase-like acetyltransferase